MGVHGPVRHPRTISELWLFIYTLPSNSVSEELVCFSNTSFPKMLLSHPAHVTLVSQEFSWATSLLHAAAQTLWYGLEVAKNKWNLIIVPPETSKCTAKSFQQLAFLIRVHQIPTTALLRDGVMSAEWIASLQLHLVSQLASNLGMLELKYIKKKKIPQLNYSHNLHLQGLFPK